MKVRNDSCIVHRDFRDDIEGCYTNFDKSKQDQNVFGAYDQDCINAGKYEEGKICLNQIAI